MSEVSNQAHEQRQLIWLDTSREEAYTQACEYLLQLQAKEIVCFGQVASLPTHAAQHATKQNFQSYLGQTIDAFVFDAYQGFPPDLFTALIGCIRAGGLCIIISPAKKLWPSYQDPEYDALGNERNTIIPGSTQFSGHFIQHLISHLSTIDKVEGVLPLAPVQPIAPKLIANEQQQQCIEKAVRVAQGHRRRPLVLTADRGRGKSTALGIACAALMTQATQQHKPISILVTASHQNATKALFNACISVLNAHDISIAHHSAFKIEGEHFSLKFISADKLHTKPDTCDLLIVDEAAGFSIERIRHFLEHFPRLILSTTVHGYEGSGRGFKLKIDQLLRDVCKQWANQSLDTPIRWAENDKLESWLYDTFLLNAEPPPLPKLLILPQLCQTYIINKEHLLRDASLLSSVYGLLIQAHYRTTPGDLRHIIDNPHLRVYGYWFKSHLVGVAIVADEGQWTPELSEDVFQSNKRFKGELLPQTLVYQYGLLNSAALKFCRIVRIAISPSHHHQKLGSHFVNDLTHDLLEADIVGVAFGATTGLVQFWERQDFYPVKIALKKETSSGTFGAVMLKSLSEDGKKQIEIAYSEFAKNWPHMLKADNQTMPAKTIHALAKFIGYEFRLSQREEAIIYQIESGTRPAKLHQALMAKHTWKQLASQPWRDEFEALISNYLK